MRRYQQVLRRILLATDFSAGSRDATECALWLTRRLDAALELLHVAEAPTFTAPEAIAIASRMLEAEMADRRAELDRALAALRRLELREVGGEVVVGFPADEIVARANSGRYDLVVLGTHGRRGFRRWIAGSVAEQVVRRSHVPVLTVRGPAEPTEPDPGGTAETMK